MSGRSQGGREKWKVLERDNEWKKPKGKREVEGVCEG